MATFLKVLHVSHLMRCITGLPGSRADLDTSRVGIAYYSLSALDIMGLLDGEDKINEIERKKWRDWIWNLSVQGDYGFGFRPGLSMTIDDDGAPPSRYDPPHLIMTYTALLSLAILRDDFKRLDRDGMIKFLTSTQHQDGSFSPLPIDCISSESDLRLTFCSFAICSMLEDWSSIDVRKAVRFIADCRTYEGGYGEAPGCEAQGAEPESSLWHGDEFTAGGPTYCAVASLRLLSARSDCPPAFSSPKSFPSPFLSPSEAAKTIRWLVQRQRGGFQGRTEKNPDACYCFWCGAALKILDSGDYVDPDETTNFLSACQFKYGGIANTPGENPDPYHTYLSLASLSLYPPTEKWLENNTLDRARWSLHRLDPLLNLRQESSAWAREHIPRCKGELE